MAKVDIRKHKRLLRQAKQMLEEYASHGFEASEYESKKDWNDDVGIYRKKIEKLEQIASIIDKNKDLDSKEVERALQSTTVGRHMDILDFKEGVTFAKQSAERALRRVEKRVKACP